MIYPKLGVKIGAGKTPGIYHPVVGVLTNRTWKHERVDPGRGGEWLGVVVMQY